MAVQQADLEVLFYSPRVTPTRGAMLSVDPDTWPVSEAVGGTGPEPGLLTSDRSFWPSLEDLLAAVGADQETWCLAIASTPSTWSLDARSSWEQWNGPVQRASPAKVNAGWDFLGYDIADGGMVRRTGDADLLPGDSWRGRIDERGLFAEIGHAEEASAEISTKLAIPLLTYALFRTGDEPCSPAGG